MVKTATNSSSDPSNATSKSSTEVRQFCQYH